LKNLEKIIVSPPFSNLRILCPPKTTRVLGTYTLEKRKGLWRVLTTLKKIEGGWVNNVGLRNGGIYSVPNIRNTIISFSALEEKDWHVALQELKLKDKISGIEINISCPNAKVQSISPKLLEEIKQSFGFVILKAPHHISLCNLINLVDMGADFIHISNTAPSSEGAVSGTPLLHRNLKTISLIKTFRPAVKVIGGGGIYSLECLKRYESAGADHFSLSTALIDPINARKIVRQYYEEN
jgi:dihydroorotate dehydrogenase